MVPLPSILSHQPRNASQGSLRSGQVVTARVISVSGRRHALVRIGDSVLRARTDLHLVPGRRLRVRVFFRGGTLVLRRADPTVSGSVGSPTQRLSPDAADSVLLGILARSGLPAGQAGAEALAARARRLGRRSVQSLRFLAILQEKGVQAPDALLDELLTLADTDDETQGDRPGQRHGGSHKPDDHADRQDESSEGESTPRASAQALGALRVANHVRGQRDHWVVLPFSAESRGVEVNGAMRVLLDSASGAARRMVLSVQAPSQRWNVAVESGMRGVTRVVLLCEPESLSRRLRRDVAAFRTALAGRGIRLDLAAPPVGFDGFSVEAAEYTRAGIDRLV